MQKIRVAIVDDQTLVCEGLATLLGLLPDLTVVGKAGDGPTALAQMDVWRPDVVVLDVRMPGMSGVAVARALHDHHPQVRTLMLTTFDDDDYLFESLRAGAAGYLLKTADPDQLAAAIRAVHAGQAVLDPAVTQKVVQRAVATDAGLLHGWERLSVREIEVLRGIAQGLSNHEIAQRLALADGTVKNHVSHVLDKLGVTDRIHAMHLAREWGLGDG
jgi:DNA-binding NarL/FixJ family response regulator